MKTVTVTHRTAIVVACAVVFAFVVVLHHDISAQPPAVVPQNEAPPEIPPGVVLAKAESRALEGEIELVGSVSYDQDHFAIVGPLVSGRVVNVRAKLGSVVQAGETLADVESPEVGIARGDYLSAKARAAAASANLRRESELAEKRISSARDRELAQAQASEEITAVRVATQRLKTLGLEPRDLEDEDLAGRVALRAPIAGTVVNRRVALGESVSHGDDAFTIADLAHLWVMLDVYELDLERIHEGQAAELRTESLPGKAMAARVSYVEMRVDTNTRTASVRIEFDNHEQLLRPGQFVTARLLESKATPRTPVIVVPHSAVQKVDGKDAVFVHENHAFVAHDVVLGRANATHVEISRGLQAGDEVAVQGTFLLKSQALR